MQVHSSLYAFVLAFVFPGAALAQIPLGEGPWYYETSSPALKLKVSVVVRGISNPWGMAFLPSGNILVAEQAGQFKLISGNELRDVAGSPDVQVASSGGLMDITCTPTFPPIATSISRT